MAARLAGRDSRKELWFWRASSVAALSFCGVLLLQVTRARSSVRQDQGSEQPSEEAETSFGARHRDADDAPRTSSTRVSSLLGNLQRAKSTSGRCMAIDRLVRLPELDDVSVGEIAQYLEPEYTLELRRCAATALGMTSSDAAFAPLYDLAQCDVPSLVQTALTALASRPDRASQKAAIELSKDGPRELRVVVAIALAESGALEALPLISALLEDGAFRDRERLVMALGRSGDPRAVGLLQKMIARSNRGTAGMVLYALGEIGGRAATETLLAVLRGRPELAPMAVNALARSGGEEARDALMEVAEKGGPQGVGDAALSALAELDGPGVSELMQQKLASGTMGAKYVAIEYAVSHRDEQMRSTLEQLARSGSQQMASQAISGLARYGDARATDLIAQIADSNDPMAPMALQMLNMETADPARARAIALKQVERNPNAAEMLMYDDSPEARAAMIKMAKSDSTGDSRAMMALAQSNDPEARKVIDALATGDNAGKRAGAMWALSQLGDPAALKTLTSAIGDSDVRVRREAVQALTQFGGPEAEAALFKASRDDNPEVLYAAANALGSMGTPQALERLEQLARTPAASMHALSALAGNDANRALPIAQSLLASNDAETRRAALNVVPQLPMDVGSKLAIDALHSKDQGFVREALETAANVMNDEVRDAIRALDTSAMPEDMKARVEELGSGAGPNLYGYAHPIMRH